MLYGSLDGRGVLGEEWTHIYVWLNPFIVHLKQSQHCLLIGYTPIQNKKFLLKNDLQLIKINGKNDQY